MALERKSDLLCVTLKFADDAFTAYAVWNVGAKDGGEWVGMPMPVTEELSHANSDDMKRFNDALGVLTSECVRRTVAAQQRMADMVAENDKLREEFRVANDALLKQYKDEVKHAEKLTTEAAASRQYGDTWLKNWNEAQEGWRKDNDKHRSWLYRLTLGFFGS